MASKPVFEHRHYKRLAAILADMGREAYHGKDHAWTHEEIVLNFAAMLGGTNPAFNRERFIAAASGTPSNGRDKVRS